jgi:hypothetical protein
VAGASSSLPDPSDLTVAALERILPRLTACRIPLSQVQLGGALKPLPLLDWGLPARLTGDRFVVAKSILIALIIVRRFLLRHRKLPL